MMTGPDAGSGQIHTDIRTCSSSSGPPGLPSDPVPDSIGPGPTARSGPAR